MVIVNNGASDVTMYFVLRDSTTHAPKTDVTVTDIDLYYVKERAAISSKIDCTALLAADSAHTDGGAFHVGQGMYRIDCPDEAFNGGVGKRVNLIVVCTGVDTTFFEVTLSPAVNVTLWKSATPGNLDVDGNVPTAGGGLTAQETADAVYGLTPTVEPDPGSLGAQVEALPDLIAAISQTVNSSSDSTAAGSITRRRGDSWSISMTLGAITGWTSLWFTVKNDYDDADASALLLAKLNATGLDDGLLYVNGAAASNDALASITVSNATTGAIVVAVDETITAQLTPGEYVYDVQVLNGGDVTTPDSGTFTITADVTRSVA